MDGSRYKALDDEPWILIPASNKLSGQLYLTRHDMATAFTRFCRCRGRQDLLPPEKERAVLAVRNRLAGMLKPSSADVYVPQSRPKPASTSAIDPAAGSCDSKSAEAGPRAFEAVIHFPLRVRRACAVGHRLCVCPLFLYAHSSHQGNAAPPPKG